jgi:hypothetical protein
MWCNLPHPESDGHINVPSVTGENVARLLTHLSAQKVCQNDGKTPLPIAMSLITFT